MTPTLYFFVVIKRLARFLTGYECQIVVIYRDANILTNRCLKFLLSFNPESSFK